LRRDREQAQRTRTQRAKIQEIPGTRPLPAFPGAYHHGGSSVLSLALVLALLPSPPGPPQNLRISNCCDQDVGESVSHSLRELWNTDSREMSSGYQGAPGYPAGYGGPSPQQQYPAQSNHYPYVSCLHHPQFFKAHSGLVQTSGLRTASPSRWLRLSAASAAAVWICPSRSRPSSRLDSQLMPSSRLLPNNMAVLPCLLSSRAPI
jgi:hypothetical protein